MPDETLVLEARLLDLDFCRKLTYHGSTVYNYANNQGYSVRYPDGTRYWYRYPSDIARSLVAGAPLLMPARCWVVNGQIQTLDWSVLPWPDYRD
jgi:hypothetical protein